MLQPAAVYEERRVDRQQVAQRWDGLHRRLSLARILVFVSIPAAVIALLGRPDLSAWIALPIVAFAGLAFWHQRIQERRERALRAHNFYDLGLQRLAGQWPGQGPNGQVYHDPEHPYQRDLDIFGKGSLFQLLCRAVTRPGQDRLAQWLSQPASVESIRLRQQAVQELAPRLDLRERLATEFSGRSAFQAPTLARWASHPPRLVAAWLPAFCIVLGLAGALALVYWAVTHNPLPLVVVLLFQQAGRPWYQRGLAEVLAGVEPLRSDCRGLVRILGVLEEEPADTPLLKQLKERLHTPSRASQSLAQLERTIEWLDSRLNLFTAPFVYLTLSHLRWAIHIERWRQHNGPHVEGWLEALADWEALTSLASWCWENPEHCWPQLAEPGAGVLTESLGHPLLGAECVANDVDLSSDRLWVVSGSNMSGKSSLLRALGCNVVLAMAGGAVRARRFQLEPLQVGASIQVGDSLLAGHSRFYSELRRLQQILELAQGQPRELFLLDEIMAGTNSHDRRIGAQAVVHGLLEQGALGLVTTHDLALTRLVEQVGQARNVHLEDQIMDGKMSFDYRVRPGVVTHSNALELMRLVGLKVPDSVVAQPAVEVDQSAADHSGHAG